MQRNVGIVEQVGSLLTGGALVSFGLKRRGALGVASALAGGALLFRGLSGQCKVYQALGIDTALPGRVNHPFNRTVHVRDSISVYRSPDEVYRFWRDLKNLERVMEDIDEIEILDEKRSRWHAGGPLNTEFHWDAEIIEDRPNELIKWRTISSESNIEHHGEIRFRSAPGRRGTIVSVDFRWMPPGGVLTAAAAKLLPQDPARRVKGDLRRFRQLIEAGEISRSEMQSVFEDRASPCRVHSTVEMKESAAPQPQVS